MAALFTAVGASLTVAWLIGLRLAPRLFLIPGVAWAFVGLTVVGLLVVAFRAEESPFGFVRRRVARVTV
jgi:hypothetical protein